MLAVSFFLLLLIIIIIIEIKSYFLYEVCNFHRVLVHPVFTVFFYFYLFSSFLTYCFVCCFSEWLMSHRNQKWKCSSLYFVPFVCNKRPLLRSSLSWDIFHLPHKTLRVVQHPCRKCLQWFCVLVCHGWKSLVHGLLVRSGVTFSLYT